MSLPLRTYAHYCGVDAGFAGAISLMNAAGTVLSVYDMPVKKQGEKAYNALDLDGLRTIIRRIKLMPDVAVGLENPTTRPDEGAERSARFGRQLGTLESFLFLSGFDYFLIAPNLWTGRLGLPGKTTKGWETARTGLFAAHYPDWTALIRGARGGLLDGRLDALLIAHFLRTQGSDGLKSVREKFGRDSAQMQAYVLGGMSASGRHRKGMLPRI